MSIRMMSSVWEDASINNHSDLLVLLALADFSNDKGDCWPAVETIARKARHSERGVQKIMERLVASGKIHVTRGGEGPRDTNTYHLITQSKSEHHSPLNGVKGEPECRKRVNLSAEKGEQAVHPNRQEPSVQPKRGETPLWEEFWAYCQQITLMSEWYAKDKFLAADQDNWKGKSNWQSYATRCRTWWEAEGRPMSPPANKGIPVWRQEEALKEQISQHKANSDSVYYDSRCTELEKSSLKSLRNQLKDLKVRISNVPNQR